MTLFQPSPILPTFLAHSLYFPFLFLHIPLRQSYRATTHSFQPCGAHRCVFLPPFNSAFVFLSAFFTDDARFNPLPHNKSLQVGFQSFPFRGKITRKKKEKKKKKKKSQAKNTPNQLTLLGDVKKLGLTHPVSYTTPYPIIIPSASYMCPEPCSPPFFFLTFCTLLITIGH